MNTEDQQDIREALAATLEDYRLSRRESARLQQFIEQWSDHPDALGYMRNTAYRLAEEQIEQHPLATLEWLRRVDRLIDSSQRAGDAIEPVHTVAFSPGHEARLLISQQLKAARENIDVCVFTITDDRITKTLLAAHHRGVKIRIISDNDKRQDHGSDIYQLAENGLSVRVDPDRNHMHHKFAVVDRRLAITGSYNWTRGATRNLENVLVTTEPEIVHAYQKEFDRLWRMFA